jgi:hypothetical protein
VAIVTILDQQRSRHAQDLVEPTAQHLNALINAGLLRPFVRTAGDEMQAIVAEGAAVAEIVQYCLRDGRWWIGLGLGDIELPLGETARESRGPAFWAARKAVDKARKRGRRPLAVEGERRAREDLEAVLYALAFIFEKRTDRQWEAADLSQLGMAGPELADELGISPQAANQILRDGGVEEERRLSELAARLSEDVIQ